ncbi:multidrug resistance protein, MATE family [Sphingobium faniae]|nr:multidrug resistance protein, MATE family [Sphingobium faniae]
MSTATRIPQPDLRTIWSIAWPMMLAYSSVPLMGFASVAVMGHLEHPRYLGGVGLATNFFAFFYFVFAFIRWSTAGMSAQARGRLVAFGGHNDLPVILTRSLTLALGIGAILILLSAPLTHLLFGALTADPALGREAELYARLRLFGAPALLGTYAMTGWFVGSGRPRAVMVMTIGANLTNVVLLLFFIHGLGMRSAGAGLAAALGEWTGLLLGAGAIWLGGGLRGGRFGMAELFDRPAWRRLFSANGHVLLKTLFTIVIFIGFLAISGHFAPDVLAANLILMQLFYLASYAFDGFANACETIAGQAEGAGQSDLGHQALARCCQCALVVAGLFAIAYGLGGPALIRALTDIESVRTEALRYYPWMVFIPIAQATSSIYDGVFVGTLRMRDLRNTTILGTLGSAALAGPLVWLFGNDGLWFSLASFFLIRQAASWWVYSRPRHRAAAALPSG